MTTAERARAAIQALRAPDPSLARVPNTVRDSIAEVIEALITPVGDGRQICECPTCGRSHWQLGTPPLLKPASTATAPDIATPEGVKQARENADWYRTNLKPFA